MVAVFIFLEHGVVQSMVGTHLEKHIARAISARCVSFWGEKPSHEKRDKQNDRSNPGDVQDFVLKKCVFYAPAE